MPALWTSPPHLFDTDLDTLAERAATNGPLRIGRRLERLQVESGADVSERLPGSAHGSERVENRLSRPGRDGARRRHGGDVISGRL